MGKLERLGRRVMQWHWMRLLARTFKDWQQDAAPRVAAAMAYYTLISLAPLMILLIALAGLVFERGQVRAEIVQLSSRYLTPESVSALRTMLRSIDVPQPGPLAATLGILVTAFGAVNVFAQLQAALNDIWEAPPAEGGIIGTIKRRSLSFVMLLVVGALLVAAVLANTIVSVVLGALPDVLVSPLIAQAANLGVSFVLVTAMFTAVYVVLPDVGVSVRDAAIGAVVTAVLFSLANVALGFYFAYSSISSVYGTAGSLAVLLIYLYLAGQVVLFGAEFTHVWACEHGSLRGIGGGKPDESCLREEE